MEPSVAQPVEAGTPLRGPEKDIGLRIAGVQQGCVTLIQKHLIEVNRTFAAGVLPDVDAECRDAGKPARTPFAAWPVAVVVLAQKMRQTGECLRIASHVRYCSAAVFRHQEFIHVRAYHNLVALLEEAGSLFGEYVYAVPVALENGHVDVGQ